MDADCLPQIIFVGRGLPFSDADCLPRIIFGGRGFVTVELPRIIFGDADCLPSIIFVGRGFVTIRARKTILCGPSNDHLRQNF